ncbi:MAG TPA: DUF2141 domain-containing protein [Allosphingosinicella sp.]|nr:DUF2141 domain-containing protein [Allosphingosinicella sp.]
MTRFSIALASALALALPAAAQAGPVSVELSGLRGGGTLYVQLQTRAQFLGGDRVVGRIIEAPAAGALRVDLGEVPAGDYAVSVWHDFNGNSRMEIDPTAAAAPDGWAMRNGEALRARPEFDQVMLAVPAAGASIPLALTYGR